MDNQFSIRKNEKCYEYINRVCNLKRAGLTELTWKEVAKRINNEIGTAFSESYFRKNYFEEEDEEKIRAHSLIDWEVKSEWQIFAPTDGEAQNELVQENNTYDEDSEDVLTKIQLEKMKLSDLRIQTNANLRRIAREQTLKEIGLEAAKIVAESKPIFRSNDNFYIRETANKPAILQLSDWHYGIEIDNYWNKYNLDIAEKRVFNLLDEVINVIDSEKITELNILNLGDLICGRIHMNLRLQSRIDVITQTIKVSEILANFIDTVSDYCKVNYYDCIDNHSRLEPNKENSLDLETLQRIIPWYLKERLKDHIDFGKVTINSNKYGEDILSFECAGYKVCGVHGHHDSLNKIVDGLITMTKEPFNLICCGHYHHFSCDEKNEVIVVGNGSLMGTDTYAKNLHLTAKPSQNLIIPGRNNVAAQIRRIVV